MEVDIFHARRRLAAQARRVVIVNGRHLAVAQVEAFQFDQQLGIDPVAHPPVEARRGLRPYGVVLFQRARAKVVVPQGSGPRPQVVHRHGQRRRAFHRARNALSLGGDISKACLCNTVDMDRERASFAENAVKYESTLRFVNGQVRTMLDAMKGINAA